MNQDPFKSMYGISDTVVDMAKEAMTTVSSVFEKIDQVKEINQLRVLQAFRNARFAEAHLGATTGYGYDDMGREKIEEMYDEEGESVESAPHPQQILKIRFKRIPEEGSIMRKRK